MQKERARGQNIVKNGFELNSVVSNNRAKRGMCVKIMVSVTQYYLLNLSTKTIIIECVCVSVCM